MRLLHPFSPQRLTAYVTKVFAMANNLVPMQRDVICDAVKFLILNTQQPDGMFREVGMVIHGDMIVRALTSVTSVLQLGATQQQQIRHHLIYILV